MAPLLLFQRIILLVMVLVASRKARRQCKADYSEAVSLVCVYMV